MPFSREGKACPWKRNAASFFSPVSPTSSPAQRVEVGKEEGRSGVQFSREALAYRGNGTQRVSSPSYHQPGAQRQWVAVGKEEGRSGVQFSREDKACPWKRNGASFFFLVIPNREPNVSGSRLERKKEGAECSFFRPHYTNFEPSAAGRSWKGRRNELSAVFA